MRTVVRIRKEGKVRSVRRGALPALPAIGEQASLVALIQALIPLGLQAVGDVANAEVSNLAGERYSRGGGQPEFGINQKYFNGATAFLPWNR